MPPKPAVVVFVDKVSSQIPCGALLLRRNQSRRFDRVGRETPSTLSFVYALEPVRVVREGLYSLQSGNQLCADDAGQGKRTGSALQTCKIVTQCSTSLGPCFQHIRVFAPHKIQLPMM